MTAHASLAAQQRKSTNKRHHFISRLDSFLRLSNPIASPPIDRAKHEGGEPETVPSAPAGDINRRVAISSIRNSEGGPGLVAAGTPPWLTSSLRSTSGRAPG